MHRQSTRGLELISCKGIVQRRMSSGDSDPVTNLETRILSDRVADKTVLVENKTSGKANKLHGLGYEFLELWEFQ